MNFNATVINQDVHGHILFSAYHNDMVWNRDLFGFFFLCFKSNAGSINFTEQIRTNQNKEKERKMETKWKTMLSFLCQMFLYCFCLSFTSPLEIPPFIFLLINSSLHRRKRLCTVKKNVASNKSCFSLTNKNICVTKAVVFTLTIFMPLFWKYFSIFSILLSSLHLPCASLWINFTFIFLIVKAFVFVCFRLAFIAATIKQQWLCMQTSMLLAIFTHKRLINQVHNESKFMLACLNIKRHTGFQVLLLYNNYCIFSLKLNGHKCSTWKFLGSALLCFSFINELQHFFNT